MRPLHDAVQAMQQRFEPYAATLKGSGSLEAAAGAAAYGVLVASYPKQQGVFDAKHKEFLASGGLAGNAGLTVGQQAAAALLKHHRPSTALPDYKGGSTPGAWRPTPSFIGSPPQPTAFAPMANLRSIVDAGKMDIGDSACLFALASLAAADAAIACWDGKRHFSFWRPVTAIR